MKVPSHFKVLLLLCLIGCFIEVWNHQVQAQLTKYRGLSDMSFYVIEFILISSFYIIRFRIKGLHWLIIYWASLYCILVLFDDSALKVFNPNYKLMMVAPLILLPVWGFYKSVVESDKAVMIVSCGFFLYFFTQLSYLPVYTSKLRDIWILVHSPVNVIMNLSIMVGFYVSSRSSFKDSNGIFLSRNSNTDGNIC